MLPHRRHRNKSSPRPSLSEAQEQSHSPAASSSSINGGGGISSYFTRRRFLWGKGNKGGETAQHLPDTLLPTTYSSTKNSHSYYDNHNSRANVTCNSFLMGGHYYPGKDKKRRHYRKRTCWYRIFCSSPWKRMVSVVVVAYILVWHGLVPLVKLGGYYLMNGNAFSGSMALNKPNWLQYDSTLIIPALRDEQLGRLQVASERARLRYGSPHRNDLRMDVLEGIVPKFYHRNDATVQQKEASSPTIPRENKMHHVTAKNKTRAALDDKFKQTNERHKTHATTNTTKTTMSRRLQLQDSDLPHRTIHNMDQFAANHSSCPAVDEPNKKDWKTTLVVQTTINRLWILEETCSRWKDPIIVVVFVPMNGESNLPFTSSGGNLINNCPNVQIIHYMASEQESINSQYPVNRLRNIGLDAVKTSHVLVVDIDFIPSQNLQETIQRGLQESVTAKNALVVPAFERLTPEPCLTETACAEYLKGSSDFIPHTFIDLQSCVKSKSCIVFQSRNNWEGHSSTKSEEWIQRKWENGENNIRTIDCFHTARYEPYVVLRWCPSSTNSPTSPLAPHYDERFHGYGKNKIELISHLRKTGYTFSILPEGFLVHNPHPESVIKDDWNNIQGSDLHKSMDKLYTTFLQELDTKYKDLHRAVKLCKPTFLK